MPDLKKISIFILLFQAYFVQAQHSSNLGRFEVSERKGCAPLDITIDNLLLVNCNPCDVDYGDGTTGQNDYNHTYTTPGTYTIRIDYQSMNPRSDFFEIEVTENIEPEFNIYTCSSNSATIDIIDDNYNQYVVDYDSDGTADYTVNRGSPVPAFTYPTSGSYSIEVRGQNVGAADNCNSNVKSFQSQTNLPVSSFSNLEKTGNNSILIGYNPQQNILNRLEIAENNSTNFQVIATLDNSMNEINIENAGIDNGKNYYCFRIGSYDACTNQSVYSEMICTVKSSLNIGDGQNVLTWNENPDAVNYTICKNGECIFTVVQPSLTDVDIVCGTEYCYQVIANFSNGSTSAGNQHCGTSFSTATPSPIDNLILKNNNGAIDLRWESPSGFTPENYDMAIIKGSEREFINNLTTTTFTYQTPSAVSPTCFNIEYTDICGNNSAPVADKCTIFLTGEVLEDNSVNLKWNEYRGYKNGVAHYRIEKYDKDGGLQDTFITSSLSFNDNNDVEVFQIQQYRIYAVPIDDSIDESCSNQIRIIKRSLPKHPDAFTPDGDGLNDEFLFYGTFIQTFNLKIYNRWGELIFFSNRIDEGWNGTYRGEPVPSGSYTFIASITDLADQSYDLKGIVAVIRK